MGGWGGLIAMAEVHSLGAAPALWHSLGHSLWNEWECPAHPEQTGISSTCNIWQ